MKNSKNEDLLGIIEYFKQELEKTAKNNEHKTLTLNDIYDTFSRLGLRIERNDNNTEVIVKSLKDMACKKMNLDGFIVVILKNLIIPMIKK